MNSREPLGWISRSEWSFVVITIGIVLVITTLPYIYGFLSAPDDKVFMGIMLDVPDHGQYFSWMRELTSSFLASNKLTPEQNDPAFFNLLWLLLGRFGRLFGVGTNIVFQVFRITASVSFLIAAYLVIAWFLAGKEQRRLAFLLVTFTSGFGWVLVLLKYTITEGKLLFPLDVYIAEGNTFLGMLAYPHFIAAAFYIIVFYLVLLGEKRNQYRFSVAAGLLTAFLGWQHTYDLILVYGVLAAYIGLCFLRDKSLPVYPTRTLAIIIILSIWPAIYSVWITSVNAVWKGVLDQFSNAGVFTPNPLHLPVLLGFTFIMACFTFILDRGWKLLNVPNDEIFLRGWFLANLGLIYIPTDYQIHMLNGLQVPLAILATAGLFKYIEPGMRRRVKKTKRTPTRESLLVILSLSFIIAVIPTNIYLWTWRFFDLNRYDYPFFLLQADIEALAWIDENVGDDDVVLSSITIGQYLPAQTGSHAYLAHWAQTLDYYEKFNRVNEFYDMDTTDERRRRILSDHGVDYVYIGSPEREIGSLELAETDFLRRVYTSADVEIFKVLQLDQTVQHE